MSWMCMSPFLCAAACSGFRMNIRLNCFAPSEPYLSIAPIAVSPLMFAFSRLMSDSIAALFVMSS